MREDKEGLANGRKQTSASLQARLRACRDKGIVDPASSKTRLRAWWISACPWLYPSTSLEENCDDRVATSVADLLGTRSLAKGGPLSNNILASRNEVAMERAFLCARVAEDNKGRDIVVLDMRPLTPIYDFFILATGSSRRQMHTLAEEIDASMRAEGQKRFSIEGYESSKWIVEDYGDIVVHVFDADTRSFYALEDLWADARRLDWQRG